MTEKRQINIFDFDGTLYPGDLQFEFCFSNIFTIYERICFAFFQLLVLTRLINLNKLKLYCFKKFFSRRRDKVKINKFITKIKKKIDWEFFYSINNRHRCTFIISASYEFLLERIFQEPFPFDITIMGSKIKESKFYHLYEKEKLKKIQDEIKLTNIDEINFFGDSKHDFAVLPVVNTFFLVENFGKIDIIGIYNGGRSN